MKPLMFWIFWYKSLNIYIFWCMLDIFMNFSVFWIFSWILSCSGYLCYIYTWYMQAIVSRSLLDLFPFCQNPLKFSLWLLLLLLFLLFKKKVWSNIFFVQKNLCPKNCGPKSVGLKKCWIKKVRSKKKYSEN